jgi:hypothetical protein
MTKQGPDAVSGSGRSDRPSTTDWHNHQKSNFFRADWRDGSALGLNFSQLRQTKPCARHRVDKDCRRLSKQRLVKPDRNVFALGGKIRLLSWRFRM